MSKRIIEYGKYNKVTCSCDCVFVYEKEDIIEKDGKKVVTCPLCGDDCEVIVKQ